MSVAKLPMACLNWWTALFFVSLVNLWTHDASGILIVKPQNALVLAGQVATLNCSTSLAEDVHWYYGTTYIYAGKKLYQPYKENYKVEIFNKSDGTTTYSLVFLSIKREDAGTYNCRENQGRGNLSSAEMTVFTPDRNGACQSNMKQDGVVIPNDCNIDPDEVLFSCSVTFNGKNPPQLKWTKVSDKGDSAVKTECQTANNRVTCNASVTGDQQMNHSSYVCHATGSTQLNIKLCTIEVKNLIYAFSATTPTKSTVGHEVQCSSDTSQTCQYKWKQSKIVVSISRSITPAKTGLYQCEADCNIRGKRCIIFDYAYISQSTDESMSCSTGCVLAICFAIVLIILSIGFLFLLRKKTAKSQKLPKGALERNSKENGTQQEQARLMKAAHDEPILFRTLKFDAEHKGKAVFGVTIFGNELYVLIMGCLELKVFDLQKLEFRRKFSLDDNTLEILWDIQSRSKLEFLYVVNEKRDEKQSADIIKIDPMGTVQKKWSANCKACRLSITREFNVLVTSRYNRTVIEYSPDGGMVCEIELKLDLGIVSPWVTLKRNTDEYIVSHGDRGDSKQRVCLIDGGGNLKHSFGERKGSSNKQLYVPVHMATYSDGHILVVDKDDSRVVLLNSELEFIEAFFSQKLRFPNRICLDEENKRLFISDNKWTSNQKPWTDGRVLVYDMSSLQESLLNKKHGC